MIRAAPTVRTRVVFRYTVFMRILAISDLHGDLKPARELLTRLKPDLLVSCGDWGDPDEVSEADLAYFTGRVPVLTTFGNHDPLEFIGQLKNQDGSPILLGQGEVREVHGLRVAAIGGIWAKSHRLRHYVTGEDVAAAAARIVQYGPVDLLLTHGCPVGLADATPRGGHGGQRCFLEANKAISPRIHLCGHLHVAQERTLKDGRQILNVGATPEGSFVMIEGEKPSWTARLERTKGQGTGRDLGTK
jgi:Icc-related predicted phosphoesterase